MDDQFITTKVSDFTEALSIPKSLFHQPGLLITCNHYCDQTQLFIETNSWLSYSFNPMEQRPEDGKWKYSNRQQVGQSIAGNAFLESQDSLQIVCFLIHQIS